VGLPGRKKEEVQGMQEVCYCGHRGDLEDRLPIVDERGQGALRCQECGHVDHLPWLSEGGRRSVFEGRRDRDEQMSLVG
jgi:hypothetical protein